MKQTFTASISQEDNWFVAQCLEIDVASQGEDKQRALTNLKEALELHFEGPQASIVPSVQRFDVEVGGN